VWDEVENIVGKRDTKFGYFVSGEVCEAASKRNSWGDLYLDLDLDPPVSTGTLGDE